VHQKVLRRREKKSRKEYLAFGVELAAADEVMDGSDEGREGQEDE
jgi:hypothetical protein